VAAVSAPEASEPPDRKEGLAASPSRKMATATAGGVIPAAAAPLFPTDLSAAAAAAAAFAAGMCPLPPVFSPISAAPGQPPALAANPAAVQMQVPAAAAAGTMTGLELHSHERRANRTRFTNHQIQVPSTRTTTATGSVAEWLACWAQAQKGPGSNRNRDAVG